MGTCTSSCFIDAWLRGVSLRLPKRDDIICLPCTIVSRVVTKPRSLGHQQNTPKSTESAAVLRCEATPMRDIFSPQVAYWGPGRMSEDAPLCRRRTYLRNSTVPRHGMERPAGHVLSSFLGIPNSAGGGGTELSFSPLEGRRRPGGRSTPFHTRISTRATSSKY
ncbi:hypothetical protein FKP32DRAFT_596582 [Trametes sanguinea]|nr:hypothetical protein FKP32DRAFT_596582 [Trametes sanguinea]